MCVRMRACCGVTKEQGGPFAYPKEGVSIGPTAPKPGREKATGFLNAPGEGRPGRCSQGSLKDSPPTGVSGRDLTSQSPLPTLVPQAVCRLPHQNTLESLSLQLDSQPLPRPRPGPDSMLWSGVWAQAEYTF